MNRKAFLCLVLGVVLPATTCLASEPSAGSSSTQAAAPTPAVATSGLHASIEPLAPFLGTWEIDGTWSSGAKLWSRSHFEPVLGGRFVEVRTWVRDGDGPVYLRYHSMIGAGGGVETFDATSFQHDGTTSRVEYRMSEPGLLEWQWAMGEATIRESYRALSASEAGWKVSMRRGGQGEWEMLMDGTWKKSAAARTRAIDDRQFAAAGRGVRQLEISETIAAPAEAVFAAFADAEAFAAAYAPDRAELRADIELAIGGRYEWLFDGETGSNGCQVLSYVPNRQISFTWNTPPSLEVSRDQRTWVVVELEPVDGATSVRLTHLGFADGPAWDEALAYFQKAWAFVLSSFKKNLEAG